MKAFLLSFLYSIFLFCSLNQLLQTNASSGNETDLLSLIAIKDRIQGLSSWNESIYFCQWQGVRCGKRHQRVVVLDFFNQSLVGSISPHIGNLSFLKFIDLANNHLYGELPREVGKLFRLQRIFLENNTFEGKIPVQLSQATNLRIIDFTGNKFSRNIPAELGSLPKLAELVLAKNSLTGEIPPSLGNLTSLQILSVGDNKLEGAIPSTLGRLTEVTLFDVTLNRLSGEVPLSLYNISSVVVFEFAGNLLTGRLPSDMGVTLPNLQQFRVAQNKLSGHLPVSLTNASNIKILEFSENSFEGQIPNNLGNLPILTWFNVEVNHLGSGVTNDLSFITSFSNLSNLRILSLAANNFGGVIPDSISNLSARMEMLYLGANRLSGAIPRSIGNLVNLIGLALESNFLQGSIPFSIGDLHKLQSLSLWGNQLVGAIPHSLANATLLSQLRLQENKLEGNIPSSLGGYRYLQKLYISRNNLNGTIPKQIFGISSLSIDLDLSKNYFTGSLPIEVGNLINLGSLDVSGNMLSGEIPNSLAKCSSLESLYLQNNSFEGTIPESLSSLKGIRDIDLSNNNLSGRIPRYLENLPSLRKLNLSFNKFEGEVPEKGIFKNASAISMAGNFKLCGGIREIHLPICYTQKSKRHNMTIALKLAISISVAVFLILLASFIIFCRKRKRNAKSEASLPSSKHAKVSYRDLHQATGGFSPTNFVGSGSFGHVYKGQLKEYEVMVAIKVFDLKQKGASVTFMSECESLRNIRHRNLVKVLTSCSSSDFNGNDFKALVFEFIENGNLDEWLHQYGEREGAPSRDLSLHQRLNIAIDVSSGLTYLHHESHVSIIHRDLKPSNILLDKDMVAHVGDFGLAKLLSLSARNLHMNQSTSLDIRGSIGYVAPEYGMGITASMQADVYSFGILLLEMFTGKRPTHETFKDGQNLHCFARDALPDQVVQIVDPILLPGEDETIGDHSRIKDWRQKRNEVVNCVTAVIKIGVACSVDSPTERMDMRDINKSLQSIRESFLRNDVLHITNSN